MADKAAVLTGGSNNFATTSEHLNGLATDLLNDGVVSGTSGLTNTSGVAPMTGSLAVNAQGTPNMTVAVTAGNAYVSVTPTSQNSQRLRVQIAAQNVTIAANSTGGTRYDWVYVTLSAANAANPNAAGDNVASITTSRSTSNTTDNGTPPTYGLCIAIVTVANGASSITNGNIADTRVVTGLSRSTGADGWTLAGVTWTYASATTFTISGDYSAILNVGDKIKLTQTTTKYFYITGVSYGAGTTTVTVYAGTDYTLANATITNNYYSKHTSPNGFPGEFAFAPTLTNMAIGTGGNAYNVGFYFQTGRKVTLRGRITLGTSGQSIGTNPYITAPVTLNTTYLPTGTTYSAIVGTSRYVCAGAGYFGPILYNASLATGALQFVYFLQATTVLAGFAATSPGTWAAGDWISYDITYDI